MKKTPAPVPAEALGAGLRRFLYLTAVITGAAVMIVEILGAKMLAPYVGTSHFVWTAQIAVTLVALAAGYYAGGRMADRSPTLDRLYYCILAAAVYLSLTVKVVEPVAYACLRFDLAIGSLLASLFLYFMPLALLAVTGPYLVRVLAVTVSDVGGVAGRLTAVGTLGSFGGTVLIGYVLIPLLSNSTTMFLTAGLLLAVSAGYFAIVKRKPRALATVAAAALVAGALGVGGSRHHALGRDGEIKEVYFRNSNFGQLQVLETKNGSRRFYLNDYLTQDTYDPVEKKSTSMFTYLLHGLARAYTPRLENALCIGLGVGIVPMEFLNEGVNVEVVEINRAAPVMAARYFDCEPDRLHVVIGDGREFVNATTHRYDTIILDAFLGDSSPSHLMTHEAFAAMQRILRPNGTLVINSFGEFDGGRDFFMASLEKTMKSVFRSVRIHAAGNGNVFFVGSDQPDLKLLNSPAPESIHSYCRGLTREAFEGIRLTNPKHGMILTDNFNPVDFYDAGNREEFRRRLALSMRDL